MSTWWSWLVHVGDEDEARRRRTLTLGAASVHAVAFVLFLGHLALRAWMLLGSWFYTDDYRLLSQARGRDLDLNYLMEPFDSQLMPVGRLVAWVVGNWGETATAWGPAITITLLASVAAAGSCWWMLVSAFGARVEVLPLYALFLFSATSAPAVMWWAAGLNQLPLQSVWCASVAAWVTYLRGRRMRWLLVTTGIVAFGLLCYVKTLLVLPVLALLALGWFATGSLRDRLGAVWSRYRLAVVTGAGLAAAYLAYYVTSVPQPFIEQERSAGLAGALAETMLATSFGTSAVGGPWHWDTRNPPTGYADPPSWAGQLTWVVIAGVVLFGVLLRRRTGRAWLVLAASLAGAYGLLLTTRAPIAGAAIGLEMRYLTETVCALVLTLGLVWLPIRAAIENSAPRSRPLIRARPTQALAGALALAVLAGALTSTATYARIWHTDNPGATYLERVAAAVRAEGSLDLTGGPVPATVMPGYAFPYNTLESLMPLYTASAEFPLVSRSLHSVTEDGIVAPTLINPAVTSEQGPVDDCGWRVRRDGRSVPLRADTLDVDWWMRIAYLSSQHTPVTVTAGDVTREAILTPGIGSLYAQATGTFDRVHIDGLAPGTTLCVDLIEVGTPEPGIF